MSYTKKLAVGILIVFMSASLILGAFFTLNINVKAQENVQETKIAEIDPAGTGFTAANAVPEWSSVFNWQWMGIGAGATITIKFTQPIDTEEYQYATFKSLNWNNYAGRDTTPVEFKKSDGTSVETIHIRAHTDSSAVASAHTTARIDLREYADSQNQVQTIQLTFASDWGEHLVISNFTCYSEASLVGKIDAVASGMEEAGAVDAWKEVFDYQKMSVGAGGIVEIHFALPIDTHRYPYASLAALIWSPANVVTVDLLTSAGRVVDEWSVRAHESAAAVGSDHSSRGILLKNYADSQGLVKSLKVRFPSDFGGGHLVITDFTCETEAPDLGSLDYRASNFSLASNDAWKTVFSYERNNVSRDSLLKIYFAQPIDTGEYPYATFDAMFWGTGPWYQADFGDLDGNVKYSDFIRGAYDTNGNNEIGLDLREFADADGLVRGISVKCPQLPDWGQEYSSYFICTDFACQTEVPGIQPGAPGNLNWKRSGISAATSVEIWKDKFDYEKSGVNSGNKITLYFNEPIDTKEYPYATFDAMFWGLPASVSIKMEKLDGTAVETCDIQMFWGDSVAGFPDTFIGIELAKYADADGMLAGLTLIPSELPVVGDSYSGHFLITEFICEKEIRYPQPIEDIGTKDVSQMIPVGEQFTMNGTQAGNAGDYEQFISLNAKGCDVLDMKVTVNYTNQYSFYFLMKGLRANDKVTEDSFNGFMFLFTQKGVKVGAIVNGNQHWVVDDQIILERGEDVRVTISAIPCNFRGKFYGYRLTAKIGEQETEPLFVEYSKVNAGNILSFGTQNTGEDYSIMIGASENYVSPHSMMNVNISAETDKVNNPRVLLQLSHAEFIGETVSEVIVSGDAFYDKTSGYLIFNSEGTVTVQYTVTNSFGTFVSNELNITYSKGANEGGCTAVLSSRALIPAVVLLLLGCCLAFKKNVRKKID